MAKDGVHAGDLEIGNVVRFQEETWRVTRVDPCGRDEVELVVVKLDGSDQLILNMHSGQIPERLA